MMFADFPHSFRRRFPALIGSRVLVALSGGADSVALLHLLGAPDLRLHREAAYVDHGTRPDEVAREISFCRNLSDRLQVPFHLLRLDPLAPAPHGREASWRQLRYSALQDLAERRGITTIATGHHYDDVAEGVLVQLLRGSGPRALAGISATTGDGVIRPLLPWCHSEILAWLNAAGVPWCEDSSNRDSHHLRNRVRHEILPELEHSSPRLRDHLVQLAAALAEDEAYLAAELQRHGEWIDPWHPQGGVPLEAVSGLAPALRTRWLHAQAARIGLHRVSRSQLTLFKQLLDTGSPRALSLEGRWQLRAARGRLWLEPPRPPAPVSLTLQPGQTYELGLPGWRVAMDRAGIDAEWRTEAPAGEILNVRSARAGEVVQEKGKARRLSSLMSLRLPRHLRSAWPVFCIGDTIIWIPGVWHGSSVESPRTHTVEVFQEWRL